MADNVLITPGTGETIGADEISSVKYQRIKLIHGADGVNDGDVAATNPLPVKSNFKTASGNAHTSGAITADALSAAISTAGYKQITIYWDVTAITGSWRIKIYGYDGDGEGPYTIYESAAYGKVGKYRMTKYVADPTVKIEISEDQTGEVTSSVKYHLTA